MIERILPGTVACAEAFDDPPDAVLFPEEEALVSRAVEKRRREFRTVRHCARRALADLGIPPAPVLSGEHREPLWPPGVVGSMTHCTGYRAAAVASSRDLRTVGIDAEPHQPLPPDVLDVVSLPAERAGIAELAAAEATLCWDRLLFCAKETIYKAWFPVTRRWLGFCDAAVVIDPGAAGPGATDPGSSGSVEGSFSARLLVPGPAGDGDVLRELSGRWLIGNGLMITVIAVAAA